VGAIKVGALPSLGLLAAHVVARVSHNDLSVKLPALQRTAQNHCQTRGARTGQASWAPGMYLCEKSRLVTWAVP
jgi:hypothetical protein